MEFGLGKLFALAVLLRLGFFAFGLYQDEYMTVKYTDIDYLVFTDAARFVSKGESPYLRETYRYTPLLAWMLVPTSWGGLMWYSFGKFVFMACDLITGWIIVKLLPKSLSNMKRNLMASIWLLNPMVITISTRGSSESVLTVMILLSVYLLFKRDSVFWSAIFLGLAIHFKIYPIIYLPTMLLYLSNKGRPFVLWPILRLLNVKNVAFLIITLGTLLFLSLMMTAFYGLDYISNASLYHIIRIDHRHNFSVYNIQLYYHSAVMFKNFGAKKLDIPYSTLLAFVYENLGYFAFVPQLFLSGFALPLTFGLNHLLSCLFLQTFAFVMLNKVITSQYFIWFLIFVPSYLVDSKLIRKAHWRLGFTMLLGWVATQALWLYNAYRLEFLGISTFDTGLFNSASLFYLCNCWMLGVFIEDTACKLTY